MYSDRVISFVLLMRRQVPCCSCVRATRRETGKVRRRRSRLPLAAPPIRANNNNNNNNCVREVVIGGRRRVAPVSEIRSQPENPITCRHKDVDSAARDVYRG